MQLAEQKKESVRKTIEDMREEFKAILDKNHSLPAHSRVFKKVTSTYVAYILIYLSVPFCLSVASVVTSLFLSF